MAASLGIWQAEPRRNGDVSLQGHHRPASSCLDSAQSTDRGQNRLQRAQQNDRSWYADLCPHQMRWPPKTGQAAKRESSLGTAGWPEVRRVEYTEEAQS